MKKMKRSDWIMVVIMLVIINVIALWCIDISLSAMLASPESIMTNGWSERNPMLTYHMGLYGVLISTFAIVSISVYSILKDVDGE